MLGRALKMTFWVLFDHLGKLILANILAVVMVAPPMMLLAGALATGDTGTWLVVGLPSTLAVALIVPVAMAGLAHMAKELIETHDGSITAMFQGIRIFWLRAAGLGCILWLVVVCLGTSAWFYATRLATSAPWLGYLLAAAALWGLAFVTLSAAMGIPALVQKKAGVFATAKLAALLVLDKPFYTLGIVTQVAALSVLFLMPPVAVLLYFAAIAVLLTSGYEMLARAYALQSYTKTGVRDEQTLGHVVVVTKDGRFEFDVVQVDYLIGGLRDALFPWKG